MVSQVDMNQGLALWERAVKAMPGGNGLLSKRPDRYAPDLWPTYYSKAKGVHIWNLEGKEYIDMAQMGIGAAILGYSNDEVNEAVKKAIEEGVSTTLNAPEEVLLAEKLLALNPFAGGVKFTRTGGEAMAMAARIARAYSKKDKIAFSGYHGWHDWYLAANLASTEGLTQHLLPGLEPKGVPQGLSHSIFPFEYNNLEELENILRLQDVGTIILEGARYDFPTDEFIKGVQRLAKQYDCLIVVDEITSGWRMTDGGVYKLNGLDPDIVVYGKAMGNGFAISTVVGKKQVMDIAQETFISSTFWTERVGFVAALKTLEIIKREKVWEHLNHIGMLIGEGWLQLAQKHGLALTVTEFKPLISMKFDYGERNSAVITYFIQEMLARGYLAATSVYVSYAHTEEIVENYLKAVDAVFEKLAMLLEEKNGLLNALKTRLRSDAFKRLTK